MDVLTFGESMVAFSTNNDESIVRTSQASVSVAGAESNVATALARLNHKVKWVSRVGEDVFGQKILHTLQAEGIDTEGVTRDPANQTGLMFKQKRSLLNTEVLYYREKSAASALSAEDIDPAWIEQCKIIHITGITPSLSDSCKELVTEVIRLGKKYNKLISFDPNVRLKLWNIEEARETLLPIIKESDIFLPGKDELKMLLGLETLKDIEKFAIEWNIPAMVVKDGAKGAWLMEGGHTEFVKSFEINNVIDEVGAGDAFAAGFLHGYLNGKTRVESIVYGHALAAFAISTEGDTGGLPTQKELQSFLKEDSETIR
jgi:2-dehydro-3-deoxygluconokinase